MAMSGKHFSFQTESYKTQAEHHWPSRGRHILAQYDEDTVVVYQAFSPAIAEYAVTNQRLGGDGYKLSRMSWIKTNFLWMMYRSGWATKPGQERVLAIRLSRPAFDGILSQAVIAAAQAAPREGAAETRAGVSVRLQWDPDHAPDGGKQERRAIQLGLQGEVLRSFVTEWIVGVEDVTPFVKEQAQVLRGGFPLDRLLVARERVYPVSDDATAQLIEVDRL